MGSGIPDHGFGRCSAHRSGDALPSNPTTGIATCCARAASGRAAEQRDELAPSHVELPAPPSRRAAGRVMAPSACLKGTGKSLGQT